MECDKKDTSNTTYPEEDSNRNLQIGEIDIKEEILEAVSEFEYGNNCLEVRQ